MAAVAAARAQYQADLTAADDQRNKATDAAKHKLTETYNAAITAAIWQAKQSASPAPAASVDTESASRWKMEGRREQLDRMP